jgi:ABC-type lipoprotein export system ATPase subunit
MSGQPVVRAVNVTRVYPMGSEEVHALRGVSLEVEQGVLIGLMGRSGSGKTTFLNIIGGLDRPTSGEVYLDGQSLNALSDRELTELRRHKIGFVFQSFALLPVLSAFENVELPMHIAGVPRKERQRRAAELLELVGLAKRMHHRPYELSGGEQQRVAIARALANRPSLILADEPTGELDSVTGLQIMRLFRRIVAQEKVTVIIATHDLLIYEIADRTYQMVDGTLRLAERPLELGDVRT